MPGGVKEALETLSKLPAEEREAVSGPSPIPMAQVAEKASAIDGESDSGSSAPPVDTSAAPNPPPGAQGAATATSHDDNAAVSGPVRMPDPRAGPTPSAASSTGESGSSPADALSPKAEQFLSHAAGQLPERARDANVERTECATCGGFHSSLDGPSLHGCLTCGGPNCVPGQKPCHPPANECNTVIGAFCQSLYECLCCPDPCYQPTWVPAANASFFADYARPRTVTRIRYDNLENMTRPDRNQFFMNSVTLQTNNPNNRLPSSRIFARLQQVSLYQEAAGERGSFFVEYPYRQINESWAPTQAGFGDVNFGVKSLLFDCEMLQLTFQMRTYMPSGNFQNNLGTGQFVVDPSILASLKLSSTTYFQGQFGNWTPVGGPSSINLSRQGTGTATSGDKMAGGVFYWLMSLNQVLWHATPDSPLIATLEMDGWSFENGGYTRDVHRNQNYRRPADGGGVSYFNIGPGLRQSVCNRLDFGGAITWATNATAHWAQPWFRFEVRFLF
jgi:hypothetical protein